LSLDYTDGVVGDQKVPSLVLSILLKIFSSMVWLPIKSFLPESILPLQDFVSMETSNKISVRTIHTSGIGKENLERRVQFIRKDYVLQYDQSNDIFTMLKLPFKINS
jgi:hypothetical protein